jgi:hypothetical protein
MSTLFPGQVAAMGLNTTEALLPGNQNRLSWEVNLGIDNPVICNLGIFNPMGKAYSSARV